MSSGEDRQTEEDCLFCSIVSGAVGAEIVYQDDDVVCFADIHPVAPTHVLVVPRRHLADATEVTREHGEQLGAMFEAARRVADARDLEGGYRIVANVGVDAGNTVAHLHLHVIGGRQMAWPPG